MARIRDQNTTGHHFRRPGVCRRRLTETPSRRGTQSNKTRDGGRFANRRAGWGSLFHTNPQTTPKMNEDQIRILANGVAGIVDAVVDTTGCSVDCVLEALKEAEIITHFEAESVIEYIATV